MLLAIDTSTGTSVAIVDRDAGVLWQRVVADTRRHAEVIGTLIATALAESEVAVHDLSGVAVGMGPGPFTGLRVGIAAGRAFCFGAVKPLIPVVSHDAVAFGHYDALGHDEAGARSDAVTVVSDARRHEVYWSAYSGADEYGLPIRVAGPALASAAEFTVDPPARSITAEWVQAAHIGMLAERLYQHGHPFAADQPLYLRSPDVTAASGRKRVSG